ncbi:PE family protein [Mycolicibacillus parakoreensis]|uniref:PE family protein n=1 Tax=Mycolicibacillus parakoreensis TaxID=1069221 RepID=A0ABY3U2N8_9MYCO|nr:PE family protein [Mycolicibacillus parakoreensis]MCV7315232.1 PE family protein [Mycolicibacillus parakoreensis]ULN53434.1 PE family protein [Mycolicibacillus parakoreensis]HLR99013.1 PE family protein [Mycolicibacillus parakoreensis]
MSFLNTEPEALAATAEILRGLGAAMSAENAAAAAPTTAVAAPAADDVSMLAAAQFGLQGQLYQSVAAQAAAVHQMLVATLSGNAGAYAEAEATNTTAMG